MVDWKKKAQRWRRAYWAAIDDNDFKIEVKAGKSKRKKSATKKAGKKSATKKPVRRKKRSGDLFDFLND